MIDPTVRPAEASDIEQLIVLERAAREAVASQKGGGRWLETHQPRQQAWSDDIEAARVYVAHIDVVVVGYLVACLQPPVARIEEVFVDAQARELGFGDALIEIVTAEARVAGCTSIEGEALPGDRETKNLYERAGITARLIVLSRQL